jgi:NADPH-dependent 7-cyano-7-deazaguanine reductase QueF
MGKISRRAFEPHDGGRAFSFRQTQKITERLVEEFGGENVHAHNAFRAHIGNRRNRRGGTECVWEWFYTIWVRR